MNRTDVDQNDQHCRRCGTCCKKGGPALHVEDRDLVENGRIPLKDLYTIRRGELVRDNVRECLQPLKKEIIKIKARQAGSATCRFFADDRAVCQIYSARPLECRVLQCWDTREIERIYAQGRLCRKDLIGKLEGLWELIEDHNRRCSYEKLERLISRQQRNPGEKNFEDILEMVQYDAELRKLVIEKSGLDPEMLDFLFGRPLAETVRQFGIRLQNRRAKTRRVSTKDELR